MPTIIYSTEDQAGKIISSVLKAKYAFKETAPQQCGAMQLKKWVAPTGEVLIEFTQRLSTDAESLSNLPPTDLIIFASRHRSESGEVCFTVHSTGNWGEPTPERPQNGLSLASARAVASAYRYFKQNPYPEFGVFLEATHHGPSTLKTPSLFIELGSTEKQWKDEKAAETVADCIMHTCKNYDNQKGTIAIALGGPHYCPKILEPLEKEYCVSHVAPKFALDSMRPGAVREAIEKTSEKIECVLLDWKGTTQPQRENLFKILNELGVEWKRI